MANADFQTEAVVLRGIRYGEADRILNLITPEHGKIGVMARGIRKTKSRFGGVLEPLTRINAELHRGRGQLFTLTGANVLVSYTNLRASGAAIDVASRACDTVSRVLEEGEPSPALYNLLCNELALLESDPTQARVENAVAFRLKVLVALGLTPQIEGCSVCGQQENLIGFSGAAGGVVCGDCGEGSQPFSGDAVTFMVHALAQPLSEIGSADLTVLRQVERALNSTVEHHAAVKLKAAFSPLIEAIHAAS